MDKNVSISKPVAPEDIRPGDHVTLLRETLEVLNFFALCDPLVRCDPVARIELTPCDAGVPLKVVAVCLPFVLVRDARDKHRTLDVRRHALARLDERFARRAMKKLGRELPSSGIEGA